MVVGKVRALQTDLWQYTGLRDEGTSVMLSVFLATTVCSYLSVLGERRVATKAMALCAGIVCLLESSQIFISSRMPALWDASVGVFGVFIGALIWSAASVVVWPRLWLGVIVLATAVSAALQMLSPFAWSASFHSMGWFPFFGYYSHTTFETLSHVIELMLLYVPLAFFVGRSASNRRKALVVSIGLTLCVAAPIEYLQGFVEGRYPDVTDIGMSLAGACLGVSLAVSKS